MSQRFDSAILHYKFINVLKMADFDYSAMIIGFCLGIIIIGIIADKVNKAQAKEHEEKLDAANIRVAAMEAELEKVDAELLVQKNIVKTLSENNQRLLKSNKQLKKVVRPNDETINYMVSLYGNWFDRSADEYHLSPSDYIKKHWQ